LFVLFIWMARASFEDNFVTLVLAFGLTTILQLEKGLSGASAVTHKRLLSEPI